MKLICVIDDDKAHRKVLEHTLNSQNYEVLTFESGSEFLKHSFAKNPFAVILDHNLGEVKTGIEYIKDIRKKISDVPIIYMTSETDDGLIKQIKASKVSGYIAKDPASLVRLRTLLDEISERPKASWFKKIFQN